MQEILKYENEYRKSNSVFDIRDEGTVRSKYLRKTINTEKSNSVFDIRDACGMNDNKEYDKGE